MSDKAFRALLFVDKRSKKIVISISVFLLGLVTLIQYFSCGAFPCALGYGIFSFLIAMVVGMIGRSFLKRYCKKVVSERYSEELRQHKIDINTSADASNDDK